MQNENCTVYPDLIMWFSGLYERYKLIVVFLITHEDNRIVEITGLP